MTAATTIVKKALTSLGVENQLQPSDPYLQEQLFDLLSEMLLRWSSINIDLGITLPTIPADDLGEPESTTEAIYTSLAIDGQDIVKVAASPALRRRQKIAYRDMKSAFGLWPEQAMPSSVPYGQGNNFGPRSKRYFPEPDSIGADDNTSLGV
jgi:hypothetical protein